MTHLLGRAFVGALSALLVAAGLTVAMTAPAVAADVAAPTITWPSVTQFNPDTTTYTITVDDSAAGPDADPLVAVWGNEQTTLPHSGDAAVTITTEGSNRVEIYRCGADGCTNTGVYSDLLSVYRSLSFTVAPQPARTKDPVIPVYYGVLTPGASDVTGTYQVTAQATGAVVAQGQLPAYEGTFNVDLGADAADGDYLFEAHAEAASGPYGPISGDANPITVTLDRTAPTVSLTVGSTFYPVEDGYRDQLAWRTLSPEGTSLVELVVTDAADNVVADQADDGDNPGVPVTGSWDGRNISTGELVPEGTYKATFTIDDYAGNRTTLTRLVTVDHARLQTRTFRRTVTAAGSTGGVSVGRCSVLRRPALRGWSGSLGYYSNKKCRAGAAASRVGTVNVLHVPKAVDGRYGTLKVSTWGGAASARPRSVAAIGYVRASDQSVVALRTLGSSLGTHAGGEVGAAGLVFDKTTRPFVMWSAATSGGNRYEVKSFTVTLTYKVLA